MNSKPSNTMAIIGLVIALLALLLSCIECVGTLAFIPGIVGLILGVISLLKARDEGHPQGLSMGVVAVSVIACAISAYQIYNFQSKVSKAKSEMKEYTSCEELESDYEKVQKEMATLIKDMEDDDNASWSSVGEVTKLGFKLGHIKESSEKLGCNINVEDFDPNEIIEEMEGEGETDGEGEGETEEESESIEAEKGN